MNILIVDDEALSVDSIANALAWDELEIDRVLKAYSMMQAQKIFSSTQVDILLCDIEMPHGSGIDLMEWIHREGYATVCIFLTSFSRFEYASSAVRLQMFDYVLKPCEYDKLYQVIQKAAEKVKEDQRKRKNELLGAYWNDDFANRFANFWDGLLQGDISSDRKLLERELQWRHLDRSILTRQYFLLLLKALPDTQENMCYDSSWRFAIKNVITEILCSQITLIWDKTFLVIIPDNVHPSAAGTDDACQELVHILHKLLHTTFLGYLSDKCTVEQANRVYHQLQDDANEKYTSYSTVFLSWKSYSLRSLPDFSEERWQNALLTGHAETIFNDIRHYLRMPVPDQYINPDLLHAIYHQLSKIIYSTLDMYKLSAQQVLLHPDNAAKENIFHSVFGFEQWVDEVTKQTVRLISSRSNETSAINNLIQYIHSHLDHDLNRAELTEVVHLHPDYLSALFRQQMGIPLSEYIIRERIQKARQLLVSTDLPISEIATQTGFGNISYFSKQFKRFENTTPNQYRKKRR